MKFDIVKVEADGITLTATDDDGQPFRVRMAAVINPPKFRGLVEAGRLLRRIPSSHVAFLMTEQDAARLADNTGFRLILLEALTLYWHGQFVGEVEGQNPFGFPLWEKRATIA